MKSQEVTITRVAITVTPCAGVWIEIRWGGANTSGICVTPCAGVWIEIMKPHYDNLQRIRHSLCESVD